MSLLYLEMAGTVPRQLLRNAAFCGFLRHPDPFFGKIAGYDTASYFEPSHAVNRSGAFMAGRDSAPVIDIYPKTGYSKHILRVISAIFSKYTAFVGDIIQCPAALSLPR
jgi:hypothetical protein